MWQLVSLFLFTFVAMLTAFLGFVVGIALSVAVGRSNYEAGEPALIGSLLGLGVGVFLFDSLRKIWKQGRPQKSNPPASNT